MFGITDLTTYILGTIFIVLLPGPNSMYVLSVAAQRGVRAGFAGAAGVFVGDFILMTLAATGAAGLLKANPALLGYDTLLNIILHRLSLADAERVLSKRIGIRGKVLISPYAELGMDVDKPNQLEMLRADLARTSRA